MGNTGPHGLSELLYAFTSCVAGNGSAFGGFSGNTPGFNLALSAAMRVGRYVAKDFGARAGRQFRRPAHQRDRGSGNTAHSYRAIVGLMIGAVLIASDSNTCRH
jgi:K+-transporting ATPase ATPase A chain